MTMFWFGLGLALCAVVVVMCVAVYLVRWRARLVVRLGAAMRHACTLEAALTPGRRAEVALEQGGYLSEQLAELCEEVEP